MPVLAMRTQNKNVQKDSLKNHTESLQHCEAYKLQQKGDVGVNVYMESVFLNSRLRKS